MNFHSNTDIFKKKFSNEAQQEISKQVFNFLIVQFIWTILALKAENLNSLPPSLQHTSLKNCD